MTKLILDIEYEYDFQLFGIVSSVRDYKLAWWLNKELRLDLKKADEIDLFSDKKQKECWLSYYVFDTEMYDFTFIKNKSVDFFKTTSDDFLTCNSFFFTILYFSLITLVVTIFISLYLKMASLIMVKCWPISSSIA